MEGEVIVDETLYLELREIIIDVVEEFMTKEMSEDGYGNEESGGICESVDSRTS